MSSTCFRRHCPVMFGALALVVWVGGCTGGTGPDTSTATPSSVATTPEDTRTVDTSEDTGYVDAPEVAVNAEGERAFGEITWDDMRAVWWEGTGLEGDPPQVEIVRVVSREESATAQVSCMTDAGFPPTEIDDSRGISWEVPAEQADAYFLADYTCRAQYPEDLKYFQPFDEGQMNQIYDWLVEETIPCYADQGLVVNDVPSRGAFVDQWFAEQRYWLPEDGVEGTVPTSIDTLCPRLPEDDSLYSD